MKSCCAGFITQCQGRMVRVHEKLVEEEGIAVCYSTLTQMLRETGHQHAPKRPLPASAR